MVRMSIELLGDAPQYINPMRDRELNLRNYKIPVIENMGVTRDQFDTIDLTDNDVKKLDNFPLLKRLTTLYLHNNRIHYIQPNLYEVLPNLKTVTLTNNNLIELGDIDALSGCKKLEFLTLIGNPLTHKKLYRLYVIYRIPSIRVLDFKRIKLAEREEAKKTFKGKKNKKLLEEVGRKSTMSAVEADKENEYVEKAKIGTLSDEDRQKIQEAISNTKSLAEIEYLQGILATGRVPEKGWNAGLELTRDVQTTQEVDGFVPETEVEMEEEAPAVENEQEQTSETVENENQEEEGGENGEQQMEE